MTREQAKKLLPVIQAFAEGKTIQWLNAELKWQDSTPTSDLNFDYRNSGWRIKPESREFWLVKNIYGDMEVYTSKQPNQYNSIHVREIIE